MSQIVSGAKADGVVQDILMSGSKVAAELNSDDEKDLVRKIDGMFQAAKRWKAQWSKDHDRWWDLWESNHYKTRKSHTLAQAIVNQIWSSIENYVAHITDSIPEPLVRSRSVEYKPNAKLITQWLRYVVDKNDWEARLEHPVKSACVTGAGWFSVEWDENEMGGRGDVVLCPIDEKFMFPAPYAANLHECRYIIEAKNVPREFVMRWEKGPMVPGGPTDSSLINVRGLNDNNASASSSWAQFTTTDGSASHWSVGGQGKGANQSPLVTLLKCYTRQDDGSMRLTVLANGIVLQDGESPYNDDDYPYVVVNVLPTLDTIGGRGLVQFVEGLQTVLNDSMSYLLDQQRFSSDPMLIVDQINLEDGQLIDNSPGAVLTNASQTGQGYFWLDAPGFNQAWLQLQEIVKGHMDSVLGNVEIMRGERPVGVNTLGGLEVVRDEANIRLRKHIKWVKAALKRMYLLIISRLRQFAGDQRIIHFADKFGVEQSEVVNPVVGMDMEGGQVQEATIPENAELEVAFGKDLPGGRQARIELALNLASTPAEDGLPMVDRQYVLEQCEIEEAPEIMQRLNEMMAAQAQAQAVPTDGATPPPPDPVEALAELFGMGAGPVAGMGNAPAPDNTGETQEAA